MIFQILSLCLISLTSASLPYGVPAYSTPNAVSYEARPQPYSMNFDVKDEYGTTLSRREEGDDLGNKRGSYGYIDGHGITRQVEYVADDKGFRAIVKTNEPGTDNQNPADVEIISSAVQLPSAYSSPALSQSVPSYGQASISGRPRLAPISGVSGNPSIESVSGVSAISGQPLRQVSQPLLQSRQPLRQVSQPLLQVRQPLRQVSQPLRQVNQPLLQARHPLRQVSQPLRQVSQPLLEARQPLLQARQPLRQVSQPLLQARQPLLQARQPLSQVYSAPGAVLVSPSASVSSQPLVSLNKGQLY